VTQFNRPPLPAIQSTLYKSTVNQKVAHTRSRPCRCEQSGSQQAFSEFLTDARYDHFNALPSCVTLE